MYAKLLVAAGFMCASLAHASDITYSIDINYSNVSAVGTITTDGTIGSLSTSDVVAFNVVLTEGSNNIDVTQATTNFGFNGTTATASGLFFDFSSPNSFLLQDNSDNQGYLCLQGPNGDCDFNGEGNEIGNISIQVPFSSGQGVFENMYGVQEFASGGIAATPEPGSLALLGTGVLGCVGMVRRRLS